MRGVNASSRWAWIRAEWAGLLAIVVVAVVHGGILIVGHRTYFAQPDNTEQFWAWYQKAAAVFHAGALPLWDGNTLAGHSFVGETQTGVFYPVNIVWLLVFGSASGIGPRRLDTLVVFHLLLGSIGFYALARSFKVKPLPAVAAGVIFSYTGVVFARSMGQTAIFFGLTLVPWALFLAHRYLETDRWAYALAAGVPIGLAVLAGHFEPPFHAGLMVLLFYALTAPQPRRGWRSELRGRMGGVALTAAAAGVVALPQLAYSLPYFGRAYRFTGPGPPIPPGGTVSFDAFSHDYTGSPASVLSLIDPQAYSVPDGNELFIGLAALVVLLLGGVFLRRSIAAQLGRYRAPVIATLAVGGLAMLGPWTPFPRILYAVPFAAEVRELGRYAIMIHVVLCLLLALVLQATDDRLLGSSPVRRRGRAPVLAVLGAFVTLDGVYLLVEQAPASTGWFGWQVVLAGATLLVLAAARHVPRQATAGLLVSLIVVAGLQNGTRLLGSTSSPLYPPRYFARVPAITYAESACAGHRLLILDDALPRNIGDVFRKLRTQNGYGATLHAPYFDFISSSSWTSEEQTRLLDERCIVTLGGLTVTGYRLGFHDPASGISVYVDDQTSPLNTPDYHPVPAVVLKDDDLVKRYRVQLAHATTVIVSAIVYPGWTLEVDGRRTHVSSFRVSGTAVFPEVRLAPGSHVLDYSWSGWPS